jgi:hypothetical protein
MVPVVKKMVATTQKAPGFPEAYVSRSAADQMRGASVRFFDSREHAWEAHETALAVMNYWAALRQCGIDDKIQAFGRLLAEF